MQLGNGLFSHYRISELYRDVFLNLALSALKSTDFTTKLSLNRTSHIKLNCHWFHSSHFITSDVNILEIAQAAEFFLSDGVVLTGKATGEATSLKEMQFVKEAVNIPVLIGSGVNDSNMEQYLGANAMIVGSYFKEEGHWSNPVNFEKVHSFMAKMERMRR